MYKRWLPAMLALFVAAISLSAAPAGAQMGADKRPLTHDDYDSWKRIQGQQISADGAWVAYVASPQEGDGELVVRNVAAGTEYRHPRGTQARFSADSRHLVFLVEPLEEDVEEARDNDTKPADMPKNALGIMDLADGGVTEVERVQGFELPEDAGGWVAYLHEEPTSADSAAEEPAEEGVEPAEEEEEGEERKDKDYGTTLTVRSLADGSEWNAASVLAYMFTDSGDAVVYTVSSEDDPASDGVYAYAPSSGALTTVLAGEGNYERMAFDESQSRLPAGMAVSNKSDISFTEDGSVVMFGIKEIPEPEPDEEEDADEKAVFDLWSWDDPYPQPQQLQIRERVENETWESVYWVDSGRFVKLADEEVPNVRLADDGSVAFAQTNVPYTAKISYYGTFNDVYLIDPMTGERTLVVEEIFRGASMSPGGRYIAWFGMDDYDWYVYDVAEATTRNLTETLDVRFDREDWDTPQAAGSYGIAGWLQDDEGVLIYDRYDIWLLRPDGSEARMITDGYGRAYDLSLRYVRLDPDESTIDPDAELLLAATNEETMASGFYRDAVNGTEYPREVIMADKAFGRPTKAKNADALMYTQSAFDEYPDLWVSGMDFAGKRVSHLGAQMAPFLWGEAELRDFRSADGVPLKGILIKPENFDPERQYPLMVYIYETLHQGLHSFRHPAPGTSVNPSYYVSNGYVMWMPDIEYGTGYPGKDALKCVLPGINMLLAEGFVDADRIGIQGHSWGGYQISYMVTQTNIFAAAEAGAPVSNMTSAYGGIRWASASGRSRSATWRTRRSSGPTRSKRRCSFSTTTRTARFPGTRASSSSWRCAAWRSRPGCSTTTVRHTGCASASIRRTTRCACSSSSTTT